MHRHVLVILAALILAACGQSEPPAKGEAGPPGMGMGGATITKKRYVYDIDGVQRDVTAVCADYLKLLSEMVADAKQANL